MQRGLMALLAISTITHASSCTKSNNVTTVCANLKDAPTGAANLVITTNCSFPQSPISYNSSSLSIECALSDLPPFWLAYFPELRQLSLPSCSIDSVPWQWLSLSIRPLTINASSCPLSCSCSNLWLYNITSSISSYFSLPRFDPHLSLPHCNFTCALPQLSISPSVVTSSLGSSLSLNVSVSPSQDVLIQSVRPYFGWVSERRDTHPRGEEKVEGGRMSLWVEEVKEDHLGTVIARCWHCSSPAYAIARIEFPVLARSSLIIDDKHRDTHFLHIRGHPLDNLSLAVSHHREEARMDEEEEKPLDYSPITFLDGALHVAPLTDHWRFPYRLYAVYSASCSFCDFDHPNGNVSFKLCQDGNCTLLIGRMEAPSPDASGVEAIPMPIRPSSLSFLDVFLFTLPIALCTGALLYAGRQFYLRRRLQKQRDARRESGLTEETRLEERSVLGTDYAHITLPSLELGDIQMHEKIGQGAFGEVFRGSLASNGGIAVAVKVIKDIGEKEAKEASLLSRLSHANIVHLYGSTRDGDRLLLVFEMMQLGDLRTYVADRRPRPGEYTQFPPALIEPELVNIIRQIVTGMAYLSDMGIVHRDLAARNCLVSGDSDKLLCLASSRPPITVKISDFGMSRRLYSHSEYYRMQSSSVALPVRWLPPEALNTGVFNLLTDIWALGVTIWEVYSFGALPFADLSTQELLGVCLAGVRPPQPRLCPDNMYDLMLRCWEKVPEDRISPHRALLHPALRTPSDDLAPSTSMAESMTESIGSAWTHSSDAPLIN